MKIALLSDVHDHELRLLSALERARELGCTHLFFMGDIATLSTFRMLCEEWTHGIDAVFGNNEYDWDAFHRMANRYAHVTLHGTVATLTTADNRRCYLTHLPWKALQAAESGEYDAVFYGHTHSADISQMGSCLLVNPGEIQGRQAPPGIGVYDTAAHQVTLYTV